MEFSVFSVVVVAAGQGLRLGANVPKAYVPLAGSPLLRHSLETFLSVPECKACVVAIDPAHQAYYEQAVKGMAGQISFVHGGQSRQESVFEGLKVIANREDDSLVLVHDAARPLLDTSDLYALLDALKDHRAACLASPVSDTMNYADDKGVMLRGVNRQNLWAMQTPQGFRYNDLFAAHKQVKEGQIYTDDAGLVQAFGIDVHLVAARYPNFKITTQSDLIMAEKMFNTEIRSGSGYDVHAFDPGMGNVKSVRLGGIDIPYDRKLMGHSDADVVLHAATDALLGAIGEGDIGVHFPPSNMDFKNMDSAVFLKHAVELMERKGGGLVNMDLTLICEKPKLGSHRETMRFRVAEILSCDPSRVNIKATTTEKLGFTGREEGIAAQAIANVSFMQKDKS